MQTKFVFIPELIGDVINIAKKPNDLATMYVESALSTLHMLSGIFEEVSEHCNTVSLDNNKREVANMYENLRAIKKENYEKEILKKLDLKYESIKYMISNGEMQDKEVLDFINALKAELHRIIDIWRKIKENNDYEEISTITEMFRKTFRDYNRLCSLYLEEEK